LRKKTASKSLQTEKNSDFTIFREKHHLSESENSKNKIKKEKTERNRSFFAQKKQN